MCEQIHLHQSGNVSKFCCASFAEISFMRAIHARTNLSCKLTFLTRKRGPAFEVCPPLKPVETLWDSKRIVALSGRTLSSIEERSVPLSGLWSYLFKSYIHFESSSSGERGWLNWRINSDFGPWEGALASRQLKIIETKVLSLGLLGLRTTVDHIRVPIHAGMPVRFRGERERSG